MNKLKVLLILLFPIITIPFMLLKSSQTNSWQISAQSETYFTDSFERSNFFDGNWKLSEQGKSENLTTDPSRSFSGTHSLKIHNGGASDGLQAANHHFSQPGLRGIVSVAFYEFGDNRSKGSVFSVSNGGISHYLIFQINENQPNFVYRIKDQQLDSGMPRTPGWHTLEFVVTEYGTYGKIDGLPLSNLGVNFNLTEIGIVSLGRGWGLAGDTYFDDLQVTNLFNPPQNRQEIFDNWSNEVYRIYKNTDFSSLINNIQGRSHLNVNAARALAGQAMMHGYYYQRDRNLEDLSKAKNYIRVVIDKYPHWKKIWGSGVTMNQLSFDIWWLWPGLEPEIRAKFLTILTEEADFWTWVLSEIQSNPGGSTIPEEAGRRSGQNNLSLITTNVSSNDHLYDTRAEENGWNAQFLATAYSMFPEHPNAEAWNTAAKCFAFHTFSKGETACGITTRTISDDYILGNHNLWPNPLYTLAGITALQQGQFSYLLAGKTPPQEFFHHIENEINSPVWIKNVADCMDNHYEIPPKCHAGEDWGDRNLRVASLMLAYWAGLQNDSQAEALLDQMSRYFYFIGKDIIRYPQKDPVPNMEPYDQEGESLMWWTNLERHPQLSAKIFAVDNYQNFPFRQSHFPFPLPFFFLSPGWNEIAWPDVSGKRASDIPLECPIAVAKENFWFKPYVRNFGGVNFSFESGKTYYIKCNQKINWPL